MKRVIVLVAVLALAAGCKKKAAPDAGTVAAVADAGLVAAPLTWQQGLKSPDASVRAEALRAISPAEMTALPPEALAALGDSSPQVRKAAVEAALGFILQFSDATALTKLLELAEKDADEGVRAAAVRAAGALSHRDVVPALVRLFPKEKAQPIREEMLAIFAREGDRRALPLLAEQLKEKEPHPLVFDALRRVETKARPELLALLGSPSEPTRRRAIRALGEIGDAAAVEPLLKVAENDKSADVVAAAIDALAMLGAAEAVRAIIGACSHPDVKVRSAAVRALGSYRVPEAIPADEAFATVRERLQSDKAKEVRVEAARTLGRVGLKRAIAPLREVAADAKAPRSVRVAAVDALGRIAHAEALPALTALLTEKDDEVRTAAAKAVGALGPGGAPAAKALLEAWKKEQDLDARLAILRSLGQIGAQEAVATLQDIGQKDPVPLVRIEAGASLLRMGRAEGVAILRPLLTGAQDWQERRAAANALEVRGWKERREAAKTAEGQKLAGTVAALIVEALGKEKEQLVREVLFRQISKMSGPEAAAEQRKLLGERVPFFRLMAAAGLCRSGDATGCQILTEGIESPEASIRFEAARRIGWYGLHAAKDALRKILEDPVVFVANAARRALARLEGEAPRQP